MINIKSYIEDKTTKTTVEGLDNLDNLKDFLKNLQLKLNTKYSKKTNNGIILCCFDGDIGNVIKQYIIENTTIDESKINIQPVIITSNNNDKDNVVCNEFEKINKKISLTYIKEKRTGRTYIYGLNKFVIADKIKQLNNDFKKILGANSNIDSGGNIGFNGDYTNDNSKKTIIRNYLIETLQIDHSVINF